MRRTDVIGMAALLAIVAFTRPQAIRPAPRQAVGPTPHAKPRPALKRDALVPASKPRTDWVLVQTKPWIRVLATADAPGPLKAEMAVLAEMYDERRETLPFEWAVRRAQAVAA